MEGGLSGDGNVNTSGSGVSLDDSWVRLQADALQEQTAEGGDSSLGEDGPEEVPAYVGSPQSGVEYPLG